MYFWDILFQDDSVNRKWSWIILGSRKGQRNVCCATWEVLFINVFSISISWEEFLSGDGEENNPLCLKPGSQCFLSLSLPFCYYFHLFPPLSFHYSHHLFAFPCDFIAGPSLSIWLGQLRVSVSCYRGPSLIKPCIVSDNPLNNEDFYPGFPVISVAWMKMYTKQLIQAHVRGPMMQIVTLFVFYHCTQSYLTWSWHNRKGQLWQCMYQCHVWFRLPCWTLGWGLLLNKQSQVLGLHYPGLSLVWLVPPVHPAVALTLHLSKLVWKGIVTYTNLVHEICGRFRRRTRLVQRAEVFIWWVYINATY